AKQRCCFDWPADGAPGVATYHPTGGAEWGVDFSVHLREPMRPIQMQHISAFSRPQTVPPVPASVPKRNLWILSSWRDLILYVGTPLLLVPMFALAQARWSAQDIYVFVAAFGAMGHHLPGMIRAYGDRALFERFRWRFILAPIFLLGVCVAFYWWDLKGIVLVVFFWGVWHGMMQTYGFCRIYDAKTGSFAALTRRLDFAACAAGIALFEVFHDVQYLSLVWIYNRSRVEKDSSIGGFMRFVFRRSGSLVGLYIGLVFAYGSLAYFNSRLEIETMKRVLTGVVAASGLLHFYYDGFIWKVRDRSTREHLGLAGGNVSAASREFLPSWLLHGLKWVAVFVIPLGALWIGQTRTNMPEVEQQARMASDLPNSTRAHWKYGFALYKADRLEEAAEQYRMSLRLNPNEKEVHYHLGQVLVAQSQLSEGRSELEQA